jgi:hypothetical protein
MLSEAKHLAFSVTYRDETLWLLPQDDIAEQDCFGKRPDRDSTLKID